MSDQPHAGMVTFAKDGIRFTYRVAAVVVRDGKILFERDPKRDLLFLPGGRVELLEAAEDAVARELHEELGAQVLVDRLLWVVENFFALDAERVHELGLYYLCRVRGELLRFESGRTFEWHKLEALPALDIRPAFLKTELTNLPAAPVCRIER